MLHFESNDGVFCKITKDCLILSDEHGDVSQSSHRRANAIPFKYYGIENRNRLVFGVGLHA